MRIFARVQHLIHIHSMCMEYNEHCRASTGSSAGLRPGDWASWLPLDQIPCNHLRRLQLLLPSGYIDKLFPSYPYLFGCTSFLSDAVTCPGTKLAVRHARLSNAKQSPSRCYMNAFPPSLCVERLWEAATEACASRPHTLSIPCNPESESSSYRVYEQKHNLKRSIS